MIGAIENAFVNRVLKHILQGNRGSNILTVILVPLLAAEVDWATAIRGFKFADATATMESAKLTGLLLVAVFGYFVGKKIPAAAEPTPPPPAEKAKAAAA